MRTDSSSQARRPRGFIRRPTGMQAATVLTVLAMTYLLVLPLAVQIITSVRGPFLPFGLPSARWGLSNFSDLYSQSGGIGATLVTTAEYVLGATVISMVIGWTLAWLVIRTTLPFRKTIIVLIIAPFVIPRIVQSSALLLTLAPTSGTLNQILRLFPWWSGDSGPIDPFAFGTLVTIEGIASVSFPFMFLMPILANMDGTLEEAGRASGASSLQVFRRVTLPALWPATLGIGVLQAILLLGALEIPLLFGQQSGGNILSLKMYNLIRNPTGDFPQYGLAAAFGVAFLVITALIFQLYRRTMRNADRGATVTGKGMRVARYPIGRWKFPALGGITIFIFPTLVLPVFALAWSSLTPFPLAFNIANFKKYASLDAYPKVLADDLFWAALGRTVFIAVIAATLSVIIATIAAYVVARSRRSLGTRALDILASASIAIPATIGGFAALLFYMVTNKYIHLNGTIWAITLVYAYRIAVSYRTIYAAIFQISDELEEGAVASGASRFQTLLRITLPLILPTVAVGWIAAFLLNAQEFTLAVFVSNPDTQPISVYMYTRLFQGSGTGYAPDQGAAMALIFAALVIVAGVGLRALLARVQRKPAAKATDGSDTPTGGPTNGRGGSDDTEPTSVPAFV